LQQEIVRLGQRQQQDQHWRQDRLRTAEQWARQGRLYSAIGLVEPLADDDATAARRKQDWAADAARLTLNDGDVLQFGNEHCRWTFRQPETDACRTLALLHQTRPASACAVATDGTQVRCVVLAADELAIGRDRAAAHLVEPGLPIRQLRLAWRADGLYADAIGGMLFVNGAAADVDAGVSVGLPAELAMYADGNGLVGEALLGAGGLYEMKLLLRGDPDA
jgi:hypothetical protein